MKSGKAVILIVLLVMAAGGWQLVRWRDAASKPIRYVRIEGAFQYTDKERLKAVVAPEIRRGFYHADMNTLQRAIGSLPLVAQVDVKRVWPDAVHIKIREEIPVVRWGKNGLLNKQGELLIPDDIGAFSTLPLITGPEGQEKKLLEIMKGLYIALRDKSLQLAEFHVNDRRAWRIKLASGLEMQLGRRAPLENMQRFLKTLALIGDEQVALMASVDTRYPNGFAVTWKPGTPPIDWKAVARGQKGIDDNAPIVSGANGNKI